MRVNAQTKLCIIIGDPIGHSLSPVMHNAAYESLGIDHEFIYAAANVKVENVEEIVKAVRIMNIRGLTCTIPHKIEVMKYLDEIDETAKKIGAVNTVVNDDGILKGYNTDWLGAVIPLEKITDLKRKKIAVLGAGGAARAIVYGMIKKGSQVKIFNRTVEKAKLLANEFGCEAGSLEQEKDLGAFDIIINATSVGMKPQEHESPIHQSLITNHHIVFDIVYAPYETRLLGEAKQKGAKIIHGIEMLLYQGTAQFELYTNHKAPEKVMRQILMEYI